jgi:glycosyltransferase involved in cell wall biosynthesis
VTVVPSAIDPQPYTMLDRQEERRKWLERLKLPPQTVLLGNASALTEQKGYKVLLLALAELKKKFTDFHCIIAGDGPLHDTLLRMVEELGLQGDVTFLGWIKEVPAFLTALDVLAMPSNYEGLGTISLEASYAGCAVCATAVGGLPEVVLHGKTGFLAEKGDHQGFAKHLYPLVTQAELRATLNKNAREHIEVHFGLAQMVEGNKRVYQSVLDSRAR